MRGFFITKYQMRHGRKFSITVKIPRNYTGDFKNTTDIFSITIDIYIVYMLYCYHEARYHMY